MRIFIAILLLLFITACTGGNLIGSAYDVEEGNIPLGYAPPWNIYDEESFITIVALDAGSQVELNVDVGHDNMIFYKTFYVYNKTAEDKWTPHTFSEQDEQGWIDGGGAELMLDAATLDLESWVLVYACTGDESNWRCGCFSETDTKCKKWSIQNFTGAFEDCTPDDEEPCYTGPAETLDVGECAAGTRTCQPDGVWGTCIGEILPVTEHCSDSIDNDCDGLNDTADSTCVSDCFDKDGDGFQDQICWGVDCDDNNPAINPGENEVCDGVDNDCRSFTADGSGELWFDEPCDGNDADYCEEGVYKCNAGARPEFWQYCDDMSDDTVEICDNEIDDDCDSYFDEDDSDCVSGQSCGDSDGGINYTTFGSVTISTGGPAPSSNIHPDSCADSSTLNEVYCDGVDLGTDVYTCPIGCVAPGLCAEGALPDLVVESVDLSNPDVLKITHCNNGATYTPPRSPETAWTSFEVFNIDTGVKCWGSSSNDVANGNLDEYNEAEQCYEYEGTAIANLEHTSNCNWQEGEEFRVRIEVDSENDILETEDNNNVFEEIVCRGVCLGDQPLLDQFLADNGFIEGDFSVRWDGNKIIELDLNTGRQLTSWSTIPQMVYLQDLILDGAGITGTIPSELANLKDLDTLHLYDNELTGPVPTWLADLPFLRYLRLDQNQLTGPIPLELTTMTNLRTLSIYGNQLTGSIPPELSEMTGLQILWFGDNQLTGTLPPEIGTMITLTDINFRRNQLTGTIPPEWGSLINLDELKLWGNQLTGPIPSSIGNLVNLDTLYLRDNKLSGTVPSSLCNLQEITGMTRLRLNNNCLTNAASICTCLGKDITYCEPQDACS